LDAIFQDVKEQEKLSGHRFVSGVSRPAAPDQAPQPTGAAILAPACPASQPAAPAAER
jgi:hypothetical protein